MGITVDSVVIDTTILRLKLREINLIIFPNWFQPEESLLLDLERVIRVSSTHPARSQMTLLIDTSSISDEEANLVVSAVAMNLLMQEDLDVTEGPEISFVGQLDKMQWQVLLLCLHGRLILENENQQAINQAGVQTYPSYELDSFSARRTGQFFFTWPINSFRKEDGKKRSLNIKKFGKFNPEMLNSIYA